jgi:methylated-DNA-[protein]-cysteine S-methyltransferase
MHVTFYKSPIGILTLTANERGLTGIHFPEEPESVTTTRPNPPPAQQNPYLESALQELQLYFKGELVRFKTQLDPIGTVFQKSVWSELSKLDFGTTATYGEIADRIGNAKASRAIGLANNRNPISIIVPCHRVIGANGKLVGYGGKIWRKEWLLKHEGILL